MRGTSRSRNRTKIGTFQVTNHGNGQKRLTLGSDLESEDFPTEPGTKLNAYLVEVDGEERLFYEPVTDE